MIVIAGTIQDISDSKAVELELERQKLQLDHIVANSPGMVFQYRLKDGVWGEISFASAHALDIFGVPPDRLQKNPALFLRSVVPDDAPELEAALARAAQTSTQLRWTGRIRTAAGDDKWIEVRSSPRSAKDRGIVWDGMVLDITDSKRQEHELQLQMAGLENNARLATVGELAAGVGHEINNPLAIADANAERIAHRLGELGIDDPLLRQSIDDYHLAADRIASVVRGLRSFVVGTPEPRESLDLRDLVGETVKLVQELFRGDGIRVHTQLLATPAYVLGNRSRLQQVVMNLLTNSRDALQGVDLPAIHIGLRAEPESAVLTVRDNGKGIAEADQARIFDSFFTTKDSGTGLGLSLVHNIVSEHDGSIELESSPTTGTLFCVTLPLADEPKRMRPESIPPAPAPAGSPERRQTVLLVDDEARLRKVLAAILRRSSYDVDEAGGASEALDMARARSYDFIITDMKMPQRDGVALARDLLALGIRDTTVVIGMTGGVNVHFAEQDAPLFDGYVHKPFRAHALRELLETTRRAKRGEPD